MTERPTNAVKGKVSIISEPTSMVVEVRDSALRMVAQGITPFKAAIPPGLYVATAIRPGAPNLAQVVKVKPRKTARLELSSREAAEPGLFTRAVQSITPAAWTRDAAPTLEASPSGPRATPIPFSLRFLRLKNWTEWEPVDLKVSHSYQDGRAIATITIPEKGMFFAQIAAKEMCPLNVELPPAGIKPITCKLEIAASDKGLVSTLRFETEWANSAAQYLAQGYLDEAKQVLEQHLPAKRSAFGTAADLQSAARPPQQPDGGGAEPTPPASQGFLQGLFATAWNGLRTLVAPTPDLAAFLVARYVHLRTATIEPLAVSIDGIVDLVQGLSDGHVIGAEYWARNGNHKLALSYLLRIRDGRLPLFTEGFSMAVSRLRQYAGQRFEEAEIDDKEAAQAQELLNHLSPWAAVVDLSTITLTFPGADLTKPAETLQPIRDLQAGDSWHEISPYQRGEHVPAYKINTEADGWFSLTQADPSLTPSTDEIAIADQITSRLRSLRENKQNDPSARAKLLAIARQAFENNDLSGARKELNNLQNQDLVARSLITVSIRDGRSTDISRRPEQIVVENAQTPEELWLVYTDTDGYHRTEADEALLVKFRQTEFMLRGICFPRSKRTLMGRILNRIFPAVVPPSSDVFGRLLIRLQRIASECFSSTTRSQELSDALLDGLYQDAWSGLAMSRKTELFWRFLNALVGTVFIVIGIRYIYSLLGHLQLLNVAVDATDQRLERSALMVIFFIGVAVGAWLSYVQRGITELNTGTRGDLEALKSMLSESIHPAVRGFYVMFFAFVAMMLMHLQVVTIKMGPNFSTDNVLNQVGAALLVGLFLGLSERTLPTVVGQRATEFMTRFGGPSGENTTTNLSPGSVKTDRRVGQ